MHMASIKSVQPPFPSIERHQAYTPQDTLIKLPNNEWRIQTRNLVYMVRALPVAASEYDTYRLTYHA